MVLKNTQRFGITTVYLTKVLKDRVREYNTSHPNNKILMSEIARQAVENELKRREQKQ